MSFLGLANWIRQLVSSPVGWLTLLFTAIAAVAAVGIWIAPDWDPFGLKQGRFVEPDVLPSNRQVHALDQNVPGQGGKPRYVPSP